MAGSRREFIGTIAAAYAAFGSRALAADDPALGLIRVPVVSSTPHGLMNGVRLLGVNPRVQGFGMVFARA